MKSDGQVVVATYANEMEAEIASGHLESEGIENRIEADDAGGAFPMLQMTRGVKILVAVADEARSLAILSEKVGLPEDMEPPAGDPE